MVRCYVPLFITVASFSTSLTAQAQEKHPDLARVTERTIAGTNEFRRQNDRKPLPVNAALTKAAQYFAGYLAEKDELSHTADGREPWDRAKKYGYDYCAVTENIAYEFNSEGFTAEALAQAFVKGWEESPGHRKNMLDPNVTETGVAVARSEKSGKHYAVQMFGRPKSEEIDFEVVNNTDTAVKYKVGEQSYTAEPRVRITHRTCTPPELEFQLQDGKRKTAQASRGARFVIENKSGKVQVSAAGK